MSSFQSVRSSTGGCGYIQTVFFPHYDCQGTDGKVVAAWYGQLSRCVSEQPTYSWQGDCQENSCYKYLLEDLACPLVSLLQVAYYFGLLRGHDWGFNIKY